MNKRILAVIVVICSIILATIQIVPHMHNHEEKVEKKIITLKLDKGYTLFLKHLNAFTIELLKHKSYSHVAIVLKLYPTSYENGIVKYIAELRIAEGGPHISDLFVSNVRGPVLDLINRIRKYYLPLNLALQYLSSNNSMDRVVGLVWLAKNKSCGSSDDYGYVIHDPTNNTTTMYIDAALRIFSGGAFVTPRAKYEGFYLIRGVFHVYDERAFAILHIYVLNFSRLSLYEHSIYAYKCSKTIKRDYCDIIVIGIPGVINEFVGFVEPAITMPPKVKLLSLATFDEALGQVVGETYCLCIKDPIYFDYKDLSNILLPTTIHFYIHTHDSELRNLIEKELGPLTVIKKYEFNLSKEDICKHPHLRERIMSLLNLYKDKMVIAINSWLRHVLGENFSKIHVEYHISKNVMCTYAIISLRKVTLYNLTLDQARKLLESVWRLVKRISRIIHLNVESIEDVAFGIHEKYTKWVLIGQGYSLKQCPVDEKGYLYVFKAYYSDPACYVNGTRIDLIEEGMKVLRELREKQGSS